MLLRFGSSLHFNSLDVNLRTGLVFQGWDNFLLELCGFSVPSVVKMFRIIIYHGAKRVYYLLTDKFYQ